MPPSTFVALGDCRQSWSCWPAGQLCYSFCTTSAALATSIRSVLVAGVVQQCPPCLFMSQKSSSKTLKDVYRGNYLCLHTLTSTKKSKGQWVFKNVKTCSHCLFTFVASTATSKGGNGKGARKREGGEREEREKRERGKAYLRHKNWLHPGNFTQRI